MYNVINCLGVILNVPKSFRISSKKFFLIYPQVQQKYGTLVLINKSDLKRTLCSVFQDRDIRFFMIVEQIANPQISYDHFCVFILLNKIKNIVNTDILKVNDVSGVYSSSKHPVFDEYDVQNVDYVECIEKMDEYCLNPFKEPSDPIPSKSRHKNGLIRELISHI
uniref:Uncharacterized protein n=1 Tax=Gracilariopsis lemaneiformis TaxID=2782 RepID=O46330_GRALE|nr:ORF2 [Gracilariopsis lemaneiformis]